jgi:hypothetical protein
MWKHIEVTLAVCPSPSRVPSTMICVDLVLKRPLDGSGETHRRGRRTGDIIDVDFLMNGGGQEALAVFE